MSRGLKLEGDEKVGANDRQARARGAMQLGDQEPRGPLTVAQIDEVGEDPPHENAGFPPTSQELPPDVAAQREYTTDQCVQEREQSVRIDGHKAL